MRPLPLGTIYFYLTEGCNLRCRHCWIEPEFEAGGRKYPSLDMDLFDSIIDQAKPLGLSAVKLTGGEPLLHPKIGGILGAIRQKNLRLQVETNGVLCTPALARAIAACRTPHVAVSLDGADAETHEWVRGVKGCFEAALEGVRNLVAAGIRPQVIMSLMRRNAGQVERVIRLAASLGASSVKFNIVQPSSRGLGMHERGETLAIEELVELGKRVEGALSKSAGLSLVFSHPTAFRAMGALFGRDGSGCGICGIKGILGVLASGSFALCGMGEVVPELAFGRAGRDRLEEVWMEAPLLREIREGLPRRLEGVCGECLMKGICLGGCIAQNYYGSGSLWGAHWYCEEAREKGLFPPTRLRQRVEQGRAGDGRRALAAAGCGGLQG